MSLIPTKPFQDWIEAQIATYERLGGGTRGWNSTVRVAHDLGWSERKLYRYRHAVSESKRKSTGGKRIFSKAKGFQSLTVEEGLFHAGVPIWEIPGYEHLKVDPVDAGEVLFCPVCGQDALCVRDICLWCDSDVTQRKEVA